MSDTFGAPGLQQAAPNNLQQHFDTVFDKYSQGPQMSKQEFKCAFIYHFGMKPSKEDIQVGREFIRQSNQSNQEDFLLTKNQFGQLMTAFAEVIKTPKPFFDTQPSSSQAYTQAQIDTAWKALAGDQEGFISIASFH